MFLLKAVISGLIIATASEIARRSPGVGGLILSLPLISLLAFLCLWKDTGDSERIAQLSHSVLWFFLPSLPMFLIFPALLRAGLSFWIALPLAVIPTVGFYGCMVWLAPSAGLRL